MRSTKLIVALLATAASLMLASAAASAAGGHATRPGRHSSGGCRVSLSVAPRLATEGEFALAYGVLSCREAKQLVTLYESSVGGTPGYTSVGTAETETGGKYHLNTPVLSTNSSFYVVADGAQSARRAVKVAAQVELKGPPEGVVPDTLHTGRRNKVEFTGTISPAEAGASVVLQRQSAIAGNEWHRIGRPVPVNKEGHFSIDHTFVVPGDANIRVVVRNGGRNVVSPSNILSYEIVQAQNPQLTIESSANPISYGQSTTISGVLAGGANTAVRLLARAAKQVGYTPVSEVKTNGSGDYTFAPQTPLVDTYYRVEGAGKSSAVLFEGVKYVLTANASATTVPAGKALEFKGTVTPEEKGHVVYLEQLNATGGNYHVIEVGIVGEHSEYLIAHTFYREGTSIVRIKIPGGPQNATTDSTPFTITVTAPVPSALTPEAPGNSTQPPEGQI
ncbi:MAG: hypothetical protein ABSG93_02655 [Solirubrobacteraceae bacterium]|jgi:hypothetical protein